MTRDTTPARSNLRSSERYSTVTIRAIQDFTCASPFSNTSFDQSDTILSQCVFDESERDLINVAAVNGPKSGILAATCDPCVQTTGTEAAAAARKLDGAASLSIAATAGGKTWKRRKPRKAPEVWQDEEVDDGQNIDRDNQYASKLCSLKCAIRGAMASYIAAAAQEPAERRVV
ncbi:uncharacterized protein M437DRAFT_69740 [Aureobasidium melanogenum CBS 110374]|uniref:Uncharacterized protein n=1 Tax=Aureobasidium melanogenum (strain CBS 110374) TaxID=1043003 RepID=A0A074VDZ7_AURM1|nr:uncharacterized protein M437DRAFT_69740 [Aureobasidium melanogenum CBS 110374]KEQ58583.1 hypothetical protein M437DRAFT_69740 [Aureobasidium melanogenum CBS 110374]